MRLIFKYSFVIETNSSKIYHFFQFSTFFSLRSFTSQWFDGIGNCAHSKTLTVGILSSKLSMIFNAELFFSSQNYTYAFDKFILLSSVVHSSIIYIHIFSICIVLDQSKNGKYFLRNSGCTVQFSFKP